MIKTEKKKISDAEFERQWRKAKQTPVDEPAAIDAFYKNGEVHVRLATGWEFSFPPRHLREFERASEKDLKRIELLGRYTLTCEPLDVDISIGGLLLELLGEKFVTAQAARRNGRAKTEKKKVSSRANGKLGGRPSKTGAK